jgi:uncharacterized tellurite resistance protein B-like protein
VSGPLLDRIKGFLDRHAGPDASGSPSRSDHAAPVSHDSVQIAACALLLELAHADGDFVDAERKHIEGALRRHFGLSDDALTELLTIAEEERRKSIDHFQFTRRVAAAYDLGQKMLLAELMWGVVMADGTVADREAMLLRKLANLLELEPAYLAQAKKRVGFGEARQP